MQSLQRHKIVGMSAGFMHSGAITEDGKLYMWGDNQDCRLFRKVQMYKKSGLVRKYAFPKLVDEFESI